MNALSIFGQYIITNCVWNIVRAAYWSSVWKSEAFLPFHFSIRMKQNLPSWRRRYYFPPKRRNTHLLHGTENQKKKEARLNLHHTKRRVLISTKWIMRSVIKIAVSELVWRKLETEICAIKFKFWNEARVGTGAGRDGHVRGQQPVWHTHTQHKEHQLTAVLLQQTAGALCSEPE